MDQSNTSLKRKVGRLLKQNKHETEKDRKAFTKLIFKLRLRLRRQVQDSKRLKTELKSTVHYFEKSKRENRIQQESLDELVSKNRSLEELNRELFSTVARELADSCTQTMFTETGTETRGAGSQCAQKEEPSPPIASGSSGEKVLEDVPSGDIGDEMLEKLDKAAEEHNLEITYNVLEPSLGIRNGHQILVEVVSFLFSTISNPSYLRCS